MEQNQNETWQGSTGSACLMWLDLQPVGLAFILARICWCILGIKSMFVGLRGLFKAKSHKLYFMETLWQYVLIYGFKGDGAVNFLFYYLRQHFEILKTLQSSLMDLTASSGSWTYKCKPKLDEFRMQWINVFFIKLTHCGDFQLIVFDKENGVK